MMDALPISILLVEDNPGDVRLLRETLLLDGAKYNLANKPRLDEAIAALHACTYDVVLLDISLPDSHGIDTFNRLNEACPDIPIIVLTGNNDEEMALMSVQAGAQDYLVKGQVDTPLLVRAIRYAIERNRLRMAVRALSLTDELTGIYNRRGFVTFTEQHRKVANRSARGFLLIFADLDDMKVINDTYGHPQGDLALKSVAKLFRSAFREADIIARIGGDEFAVIAFEKDDFEDEIIRKRLVDMVTTLNSEGIHQFSISLSVGITRYDPLHPCSLDSLLASADRQMYDEKRHKKLSRVE
ncbi:MAG: diguanylate cyclase [bacterium]